MNTAQKAIDKAYEWIGSDKSEYFVNRYNEIRNGVSRVGTFKTLSWSLPMITCAFLDAYGEDEAKKMLCGAIPSSLNNMILQFSAKGQKIYNNPQIGDIVVFLSDRYNSCFHCGVIVRLTNDFIYVLEGGVNENSSAFHCADKVAVRHYAYNFKYISCFLRPQYDEDPMDLIRECQYWLKMIGYDDVVETGEYDIITKTALVKKFQDECMYPENGKLTKSFFDVLEDGRSDIVRGRRDSKILVLQNALKCKGFSTQITGKLDNQTVVRIKEFQKSIGVFPDGNVCRELWFALLSL